MKTIITILLTAAITTAALYFFFDRPENNPIRDKRGRIPIKDAAEYADGHRDDRSYSRWRTESKGVWYETTDLKNYLGEVEVYTAPAGYQWKVAVVFGGVRKIGGDKKKMLSMFTPILVKQGSTNICIDAVTAYNENRDNPQEKWSSTGLTYAQVYKFFTDLEKTLNKTCPGPGCIVYDEGHLFP